MQHPKQALRIYKSWLILILIITAQATFADYQSGLDAYNNADYETALKDWKEVIATPPGKVSPAMYAETNYAIGMLYWMGQYVPVDYAESATWLQKAADLGHAGAQAKLAFLYTRGLGVEQNPETAFDLLSKSAKQGDIDGQYNLGIFYLNGWGTAQNKTMAAQYLAAAAAQGDTEAEAALHDLLPTLSNKKEENTQTTSTVIPAKAGTSQSSQSAPFTLHPTSWILTQPPTHYTIQVIGLRSKPALSTLIKNHENLAPFATYTQQKNNKPLHILIQGNYPSIESARQAKDNFPPSIQKPKDVWIRQFQKIQALITPITTQN